MNEIEEEWRDIDGYEGYYQVSNLGRIKSLERYVNNNGGLKIIKEKILSLTNHSAGYYIIKLSKNNKLKTFYVHRLVGITFIDNPENKPQINHIDGNKKNDNLLNLEWVTHSENIIHSYKYLNHKKPLLNKLGKECINSKLIYQYDLNGNKIGEYWGSCEIKRKLGIGQADVSACCNGKQKTAGEFQWKYASDIEKEIGVINNLGKNNKNSRLIYQYTLDGEKIGEYWGIGDIYRLKNFNKSHISACCRGKRNKANGFKWKYASDVEKEKE